MFDCGENTLEQLYNHYPIDRTEKTLSSLRVVFLTHIHADHTLGLMDTIEKYA